MKDIIKSTWRFLPALKLVWKSSPSWTIARITLVIIQGILPLAIIYLTKLIVDTVTITLTNNSDNGFEQILPLILLSGTVTILNSFCQSLAELVNTAHSQKVTDHMQGIIQAKSIEADLEYYENAKYHDALKRAQQEAPYRPPSILNRLAGFGQNGISLVAMAGLLLTLHWGIMGILLLASIPAVLVRVKFSRMLYSWQRRRTELERQSAYLGWLVTGEQFAKEIRLFDLGNFFTQQYGNIREQLYQEKVNLIAKRSLAYFLAQSFSGLLVFTIFAYLLYQTVEGFLMLGSLVLYCQALQRGENNLRGVLVNVSGLYEDNLFLANLYEFLEIKPKIKEANQAKIFPQPITKKIIFQNVSFQYSDSKRQALKNINLQVKPGETIALVGENGSGKTTLIKLLCRLYDPTAGKITIDDVDISQFKVSDLRRQIGVIFQDYAKYHFSVAENIRLGNLAIKPGNKQIIEAANRSGADEVINRLPNGYDTILGKLFTNGEELSIGQWQKVALARAFIRDSQVIVLDEPTSAMDPQAEYEVFHKFRQLIENQAAILITHRLATVKMADYIYVLNQGQIIESGTHNNLMSLKGKYAQMFEIQAQNYRFTS